MSEREGQELGPERVNALFYDLSERLASEGEAAHLFVVGGAAIYVPEEVAAHAAALRAEPTGEWRRSAIVDVRAHRDLVAMYKATFYHDPPTGAEHRRETLEP